MPLGSITSHIDLPQTAIMVFFLGFLGLVWALRRLDKREGYPMKASPFSAEPLVGFPNLPDEKTYLLLEGGSTVAPHKYEQAPRHAEPLYRFDGTPLAPVGNPLLAGVGPGAWVMRRNEPMLTEQGELMLQPLRNLPHWSIGKRQADPRGMAVLDRRFAAIGTVRDIWIDLSIEIIRMLEVELRAGGHALVPIFHAEIGERSREVRVTALEAHQFAELPMPVAPDRITAREEDRLNAYFAAGYFYRDTPGTFSPTPPSFATSTSAVAGR